MMASRPTYRASAVHEVTSGGGPEEIDGLRPVVAVATTASAVADHGREPSATTG